MKQILLCLLCVMNPLFASNIPNDERVALLEGAEKQLRELNGDAAFKASLTQLQADFLTFRDSLSRCIYHNFGHCSYAMDLKAESIAESSEWYVKQIKEYIFHNRKDEQ